MVQIKNDPLFNPRPLRVVCVGAGFGGLLVAHQVKYNKQFDGFIDFQIYEKNAGVGGTWFENRYPGVACDVPAHLYTFPFEQNPDWSSFYVSGPEILAYITSVTKKYGLDQKVKFRSKVVESVWDDDSAKWKLKVDVSGKIMDDECDVLINAAGFLNKWDWPAIDGLNDFKGKAVHSADWDEDLVWSNQRVAIIGNGSSAIQIAPHIQRTASKMVNFIRSPTWISANYLTDWTKDGANFKYTEEEKRKFYPNFLDCARNSHISRMNQFFYALFPDAQLQKVTLTATKKLMEDRLSNAPELREKLIPTWPVGCRRLTPGDGYLEAISASNARCNFSPILNITPTGIQTEQEHEEFDIIICATGFNVSFRPFWKMIGRNGVDLNTEWAALPEAYFGVCAPDHPNYFVFNGPNSPVGHGVLLSSMLLVAQWMLKWCKKISTEDIKSVCVTREAVRDYNEYSQEVLKGTVWAADCKSWYKNGKTEGKVTALYAGSVLHFRKIIESFRVEDFKLEYQSANRFRFMGNGFAKVEAEGGNVSYYLDM
ncbi:uncharacterized protein A1O9_05150 [Exophiala aquamarina CBS 119918]|uniref:Cyclohexanone monooxygenase n=1 Tax=Exophiala aquamarina CBS 119918 TaxID=1182545 RepID=A0A072PJP6_9EURO|nr:uncharacterized protein A1O9_05150 [Exophiala aquamarina CBS 119918]KEF60299.1 hypothetical protein A1O9_05150 [Exophiala aquamarina CBS 119918]